MTKRRLAFILMALVMVLGACSRSAASPSATQAGFAGATPAPAIEAAEDADDSGRAFFDSPANTALPTEAGQAGQDRLIIRTGDMDIVVEDTEASIAAIGALARSMSGWVVSSAVYQAGVAKAGSMTIRVPAERYDEALLRVKEMALEVQRESTNSQDVTEEFVDLSARLGNLEATAERVRSFLEEARDVEDALAVNQELSRLEAEIEVIKGRLQYLSQSAAFSVLTINLTPDALSQPIEIGGWRPEGVAREAIEDLVRALQGLADFLIRVALYVLPLALIVGLPLYLVIRAAVRRRGGRPQTPAPPAAGS